MASEHEPSPAADPTTPQPSADRSDAASATRETASDLLRQRERPLDAFFSPRAVAVIGASESPDSAGRVVVRNLVGSTFGGTVYPVCPDHASILGVMAYPTLSDVPEKIDLAVIATPSPTVPDVVAECGAAGVRAAIVVSAGFRESGMVGSDQGPRILAEAAKARMRIMGPGCLGLMCPPRGLNATVASDMALPGTVAFLSQSNALSSAVLAWSLREYVGFSALVSVGSMLNVGWGDLIDYLGDDANTRSIVIYMETIGDARAFLSAAREVALTKPIIVVKAGRTDETALASQSHTGSPAGNDEVLDAAFRRCGVLRVNSVADLFHMAEVLARQPRPRGPRLTIISNAGGPGVIAADALVTSGGKLAELSDETLSEMDAAMPPAWSRSNPVDILGDADPARYASAVRIASEDANSDGLLVILTDQTLTEPTKTAEELRPLAKLHGKPIVATWMGGADVVAGETVLNQAGIPTFPHPDTAARTFSYMWQYTYSLRGIYETPSKGMEVDGQGPDRAQADEIVHGVRASGRTLMLWGEAQRLLTAYGIPTVETLVANDEEQAVRYARAIGYPVVMKPVRQAITQETGAGIVQLNLLNADAVRKAFHETRQAVHHLFGDRSFLGVSIQPMVKGGGYEVVLASRIDPQFGPVLQFGAGGRLGAALKDRSMGLPPLTTTLARRMMENTQVFAALQRGPNGELLDLSGLEQVLVRFSYLVVEQRWIAEMRIDPLLVSAAGPLALGARVSLHGREVTEEMLPALAIRPYPVQYVAEWEMRDGTKVTIRPIRPEDEPLIVEFHRTLSEQSVYMRYFHPMKLSQRVAHERMIRICFNDYEREIALVAEHREADGSVRILGVARLSKLYGTRESEFSMLVNDAHHGKGLGTELLRRLIDVARDEKLTCVKADILPENYPMQHVCEKLGFVIIREMDADMYKARLDL